MARAYFVKSARKAQPGNGIKKGDSYYWWKFRFGGKHVSKTAPRRSQLTQSEFKARIYDIEDNLNGVSDLEEAKEVRDNAVTELQDLASECEDKLSNMPDSLQDSPTGQMLQDRADACNTFADDLDNIDLDLEKDDSETEDEFDDRVQDAISELSNFCYGGE